jgi:hypothetical protein
MTAHISGYYIGCVGRFEGKGINAFRILEHIITVLKAIHTKNKFWGNRGVRINNYFIDGVQYISMANSKVFNSLEEFLKFQTSMKLHTLEH